MNVIGARAGARLGLFVIVTATFWAVTVVSHPPVPHPARVGVMLTVILFVIIVGSIPLESRFGKAGRWVAAVAAVIIAGILKNWVTS